jgi:O-acetyl-ADP-ribose deacetylase (regulator of RNase III)
VGAVVVDLVAVNPGICAALEEAFRPAAPDSTVHCARFEEIVDDYDVMVAAANSFGLMDGGIDAAVTAYFGGALMNEVQRRISRDFQGEQPVGTCIIVPIESERPTRWLAHTPTMQVPLDISGTTNVYFAMKALLREVAAHEDELRRALGGEDPRVLCPALGTGTGRVPPEEAARQMALAFRNHVDAPTGDLSWDFALRRYSQLVFPALDA